jgi:tetratricopeptide (TPR) repeat protein
LEALRELPEDVERSRLELKLRFALGPALIVSRGYAVPEVERTYARALELARGHHDAREVTRALRGLWNVYLIAGEFGHARKLATELLARARTSREPGALGVAHAALGETLFHAGELPRARRHLERALALDRRQAVAWAHQPTPSPGVLPRVGAVAGRLPRSGAAAVPRGHRRGASARPTTQPRLRARVCGRSPSAVR